MGRILRTIITTLAGAIHRLSLLNLRTGPGHFVRYAMYQNLQRLFAANPAPAGAKALSVSHSRHLIELLAPGAEVCEANFPDANILDLPFADGSFDLVVSDQVFEHIEGDPQRAIDETLRVTRPGGRVVHTTCFLTPNHGPGDYWRFTPEGLQYLCRRAARVDESSGWGHPFVFLVSALGLMRAEVPAAKWHPFHWLATMRRPSYDFVVWVVATK